MSTGPADLLKYPSVDPKILFAALSMPFKYVHSWTGARDSSCKLGPMPANTTCAFELGIFYVSVYILVAAGLTLWSLSQLEETGGRSL